MLHDPASTTHLWRVFLCGPTSEPLSWGVGQQHIAELILLISERKVEQPRDPAGAAGRVRWEGRTPGCIIKSRPRSKGLPRTKGARSCEPRTRDPMAPDEMQEDIIEAILSQAQTGASGDGKIFVEPVADAVRIRTEERGSEAI